MVVRVLSRRGAGSDVLLEDLSESVVRGDQMGM